MYLARISILSGRCLRGRAGWPSQLATLLFACRARSGFAVQSSSFRSVRSAHRVGRLEQDLFFPLRVFTLVHSLPLAMLRTTATRAQRSVPRLAAIRRPAGTRPPAPARFPPRTRSFSATPHQLASSSTQQQHETPRLAGQGEKGLTVALGNSAETTLCVRRLALSRSGRLLPWPLTIPRRYSSYIWLRDHCREERSFHPQTKQRLIDTFKVNHNSRPPRPTLD